MAQMFFNEIEAARIAQDMERSGLEFYERMAARFQDRGCREMFLQLASDEKTHLAAFEELERALRAHGGGETIAEDEGQMGAYIAELLKTQVFSESGGAANLAARVTRDTEAIAVGMKAERDSIVFYREMIDFVDSKMARDAFASILKEERRHLTILGQRGQEVAGKSP